MAHLRRSPQHRIPSPPARKYPLRRTPPSRRRRELDGFEQPSDIRPVLVPLHQNLRRLPSRLYLGQIDQSDKHTFMAPHVVKVGTKRKRVTKATTSNENAAHYTRASTRSKRRRSDNLPTLRGRDYITTTDDEDDEESGARQQRSVDEDDTSGMDIDTSTHGRSSSQEISEAGTDQDQTEDDDNHHETEHILNSDDEDDSSMFSRNFLLLI